MEIKLKLYNNTGLFDNTKTICDSSKIKIKIDNKLNNDYNYFANYNNENYQFDNGFVEIPIKKGIAKIIVYVVKNGEIVKSWTCEDLIVNEINNKIECIPELENLKNEIELLKKMQNNSIKQLEKMQKILTQMTGVDFGGL